MTFTPLYAEFSTIISNAFISTTEDFFSIFYSISEMCINLEHFGKKDECPGQSISEMIVS